MRWHPAYLPNLPNRLTRGCRCRHPYVLVCAAVVEQKSIALLHHAFHKNYVGDLPGFFPIFFGRENRLIASPEQPSWVVAVEDCNSSAIDQLVVCPVVNQNNSVARDDGRRARLGNPRIEAARPD